MPPSNKHMQLLEQGLSAFVFQHGEGDMPVLGDNPLFIAPWREELPAWIAANNPSLSAVIQYGIQLDSGGGITFSSLEQATD